MNWLKKGPELKMPKLRKPSLGGRGGSGPQIKPPAFLADLYYDLRDRRLLLPIALVLVAIAAVPFLLGGSGEPELPTPTGVGAAKPQTASASLTVVEATPGLRDYRKRLDDRTATDPFKQRHTGLPESVQLESTSTSSTAGGGSSSETVTIEGGSTGVEADPGGGAPGGSSPGGGSNDGGGAQQYELVIDVQLRRTELKPDGTEVRGELETRKDVSVLTQLPGKKTPVVTTFGANYETRRLAFLVSRDVSSIGGEFACLTRANDLCEVLEVGLGTLLEFVYEPSGARYELKVTTVDVVPARKKRAAASSSRVGFAQADPGLAWEKGSGSVSEIAQTKPNPR